jgi:hypothetical protein
LRARGATGRAWGFGPSQPSGTLAILGQLVRALRELRTRAHAPTSDGSHRATDKSGAATPELR